MSKITLHKWMKKLIQEIPTNEPIALLVRHSLRPPLPEHRLEELHLPITFEGWRLATQLGKTITSPINLLHVSPFKRCEQTAAAIAAGAGQKVEIQPSFLLATIDILDIRKFKELEKQGISLKKHNWLSPLLQNEKLPGFTPLHFGAPLLCLYLKHYCQQPGFHIFCTHDHIIAYLLTYLIQESYPKELCPRCLEGILLRFKNHHIEAWYRDLHWNIPLPSLEFSHKNVELFGHLLHNIVFSSTSNLQYCLAGGAFKTLLTGKFPNDVDIWPSSNEEREKILQTLLKRGAIPLQQNHYCETFQYHNLKIEIAFKNKTNLQQVVKNFDIPLACVGFQWNPQTNNGNTFLHPTALEDIQKKQIQLFLPPPNPSYILSSLERIQRYQKELNKLQFTILPQTEQNAWQYFEKQSPQMQQKMLDRYLRTSRNLSLLPTIRNKLRKFA